MSITIPKSRGPYDIELDGIGLYLGSAPDPQTGIDLPVVIDGQFTPVDQKQVSDVPAVWDDWSLGMGYTQRDQKHGGYSYALGFCTRVPGMLFPAGEMTEIDISDTGVDTTDTIVDATDFGTSMFMLTSGNQVLRLAADGTVSLDGTIAGGSFAGQSLVAFNGQLYASGGVGGIVRRLASPVAGNYWASSGGNYGTAPVYKMCKVYWVVGGVGSYWLVGVFGTTRSFFRRTDGDPLDWTDESDPGAWSDDTQIGDTTYPILSLAASNRVVAFVKSNGIHRVDGRGYAPNLTEYWEEVLDDTNGLCSKVFDGKVYAAHVMGLDRVDISDMTKQDEPSWCQPGHTRPNVTPIYGRTTSMTNDQGWLLTTVWNGDTSYLLYGKEPRKLGIDSIDPMLWHGAEAWWEGEIATWMKVSSRTGRPYLYIATTDDASGELSLYKIFHPRAANLYQEWINGTDVDFRSSCSIFFAGEDYGDNNAKKIPRRGDLVAGYLDRNHTIQVYANADGVVPSETLTDGRVRHTLIPPMTGTYTLTLDGYGTTAALSGYEETVPSSSDNLQDALAALAPAYSDDITVTGANPFIITLPAALDISCSRGSFSWWLQGRASSSPRQTFLPSNTTAGSLAIMLRIDANTTDNTPVVLWSLKLRSSILVDQVESMKLPLKFGSGVRGKEGGSPDGRDPLSTLAQVQALMAAAPVEMISNTGHTMIVKVEPGIEYRMHEEKDGWYIEAWVTISIVKRPFYWNSGAFWSDVYIWAAA